MASMSRTRGGISEDVDTAHSAPPKPSSADSGLTYRQGWNFEVLMSKISPELVQQCP
jgi:hypothetical protein